MLSLLLKDLRVYDRDLEHFISDKKIMLLFTFVRGCFESFRRDLNKAKAVYISECNVVGYHISFGVV